MTTTKPRQATVKQQAILFNEQINANLTSRHANLAAQQAAKRARKTTLLVAAAIKAATESNDASYLEEAAIIAKSLATVINAAATAKAKANISYNKGYHENINGEMTYSWEAQRARETTYELADIAELEAHGLIIKIEYDRE